MVAVARPILIAVYHALSKRGLSTEDPRWCTIASKAGAKPMNRVPIGNTEISQRAISKAKEALNDQDDDFVVAFCEGIIKLGSNYFTASWCAVLTRQGKLGLGGGTHIQLPAQLRVKLDSGVLEETDIEAYIQENFKQSFQESVEYALMSLGLTDKGQLVA